MGDLQAQTKYAHRDNTSNIIISPDTIEYLAKKLCEKSYFQQGDIGIFEDALFLAANEHEKALFHEDDAKFYSKSLGDPDFPITLELGPSSYLSCLVDYLFNTDTMTIKVEKAEKELLQYAKDKRKEFQLTKKADIASYHLDIYPNSGTNVSDIIADALKEEWIESFISYDWHEPVDFYRLSPRAINWIFGSRTGDYDEEWLLWNKGVDKLLSKSSLERRIEPKFLRLKAFIKEAIPEEFVQRILYEPDHNSSHSWKNGSRLQDVKERIKNDIADYKYQEPIFHVTPRLLLDYNEVKTVKDNKLTVSVIIDFMDKEGGVIHSENISETEFVIARPHPNKRHISAINSDKHLGKYLRVPNGTVQIECTYFWTDAESGFSVEHKIAHPLTQNKGNSLFSAYHDSNYDRALHQGRDRPISFFNLAAIRGAARNIDELQTKNRFIEQLYKFERNDGITKIEEHFPLTASALHYYW